MKACRVYLEDGTDYITSINGTDKEIRKYFIGRTFNYGIETDIMIKCINVEIVKGE